MEKSVRFQRMRGEINHSQRSGLHNFCPHTPAVSALISDTGIECQAVLRSCCQATPIHFGDFLYRGHLISPTAQFCGVLDFVSNLKGVDLTEVIICPSIMCRQRNISTPQGCLRKMPDTFSERCTVRSLVDFYR